MPRSSSSGATTAVTRQRYEDELRVILTRLAPRPTLLYTVTEYRPAWAEVNETVRKLAGRVRQRHRRRLGADRSRIRAC